MQYEKLEQSQRVMNEDWLNYCDCGEYLMPNQLRCDDKKYGCRRLRRGLYCTNDFYHNWIAPKEYGPPNECPKCKRIKWEIFINNKINYLNKDKAYWKYIFNNYQNLTYRISYQLATIKDIKQKRYELRRPKSVRGEDPVNDYGPEIGQWLNDQINSMVYSLDCVNNIRFANKAVRKDVKRYKKRLARGCCGYQDWTLNHPSGRTFLIGCNYGH